jgi:predicted TIM-barrel fold metal-dependent hydrolase
MMEALGIIYEQNNPVEPHLLQVAKDFPKLSIVLCHCTGTQTWNEAEAQAWRDGISALSMYPNVVAKLGGAGSPHRGFGLADRPVPVGSEELAAMLLPWYGHVIGCFGVGRCMFESNFPADKQSFSYTVIWNAYKRVARALNLTPDETAAVCGGTATRVYRLQHLPTHGGVHSKM